MGNISSKLHKNENRLIRYIYQDRIKISRNIVD